VPEPKLRDRLRYWFDTTMSRGTPALIGWLALVSVLLILVVTAAMRLIGPPPEGTASFTLWANFNQTFKLGAPSKGDLSDVVPLIVLAVGGIFIVSVLVGLLTSGMNNRIKELRKGRSAVIEKDHTVVLGWTDHIYTVVSELAQAPTDGRRPVVVILAEKDKTEMEDALRDRLGRLHAKVVCRTGSPIDTGDLRLVNPAESRAVIVLSRPEDEDADADTVKSLLAVTHRTLQGDHPTRAVAGVRSRRNLAVARLAAGEQAIIVDADDIIARLLVQTGRQPGLSAVYLEIMQFDGCELYIQRTAEPSLVGATYRQALDAYPHAAVMGYLPADGTARLNPPMDTVLTADDRLVFVADKIDDLRTGDPHAVADPGAVRTHPVPDRPSERLLLLGWNRRAAEVVRQLEAYVPPGSEIHILSHDEKARTCVERLAGGLRNLNATVEIGDTLDRLTLEATKPGSYDHVLVLCDDARNPQRADARVLSTLLHLRDIATRNGEDYSIVSEMRDERDRALAEVSQADDFIVSDKLISLLLTRLAVDPRLRSVYDDLFDPEGAEIYLKSAADYVEPGREITFATVVDAAARRGETAIGYRHVDRSNDADHGVTVNPAKDRTLSLGAADKVIVLAEDG
jgi:hypothetical protein